MGGKKSDVLATFEQHLQGRFGPTAKSAISKEVAKLASKTKISSADLTAVERAIVDSLRQERPAASDIGSNAPASAPNLKETGRSTTSDTGRRLMEGRITPPFKPAVEIPKKPLQRVPDQWDLIIRYDQTKFGDEERTRVEQKRTQQARYKRELDRQMEEIEDRRTFYAEEKARDRSAILLEQDRISRDEALEHERQEERNKAVLHGCQEALMQRQKKLEREQALAKRERDELLARVQREEQEDAQKEAIRRDRMQKRAQEINRHVMESIELKRKRKIADAEEERKMMARYARELEQREEERAAGIQALKDRMLKIAGSVGKMVGESAAEKERQDERRMMETLAAAEQKAKEAEEERMQVKKERLKAMKDCLEDQIHLKDLRVRKEHAEMALQGKIWKEEADEANAKEAADAAHRRQMRQNLDRDLMKQLNTDGIDEEQRFRPDLRVRERQFNQDIFRQMVSEGFDLSHAEKFLVKPGQTLNELMGKPDYGKAKPA
jgi:hypothetical protein